MLWWIRTAHLSTRQGCCSWSRAPLRANIVTLSKVSERTYVTFHDHARPTTPIEKLISDSIRATGPISVSSYIQHCLSHPTEGYYMKQRADDTDVFGVRGDFITSPEISQVFGEVGIWFLSQWVDASPGKSGSPKIRLVELGPGRGTLMDDILRTLATWSHAKAALSTVHLVETSSTMRSQQDQKLAKWRNSLKLQIEWYDTIDDIPQASEDEFTMTIAHEFFDALPVHILEKTQNGFREVLVDLSQFDRPVVSTSTRTALTSPYPFRFVLSPTSTPRSNLLGSMSPRFSSLPLGSRIEVSSTGWRIARKIGEMVSGSPDSTRRNASRGAALIIDYGDEHAFGASFRAFRTHNLVDVFDKPGMSDLTTNVDFAFLKEALKGVATAHGPLRQSTFLLRMGLAQRVAALMERAPSDERRVEIEQAGQRLVDRAGSGMGTAYRALGVTGLRAEQTDQVWPFVSANRR